MIADLSDTEVSPLEAEWKQLILPKVLGTLDLSMIGMIDQVHCPTLFHFGDSDAYIPNDGVEAVAAAIIGRDGFVVNVENAGHAFDNHESEVFWNEAAAKSAWAKTMSFLEAARG
jgi:dienelactone hydrolase